jgi:hypothetical protein
MVCGTSPSRKEIMTIPDFYLGLSFGHNLCFKYPNGSWEPILDIYVPKAFQLYNKLFNPMGFDPWNRSLKIWDSIGTPTLKMGIHLGVWGFILSHSLTLLGAWNVTPKLHSWPTPLQAPTLVTSPKLKLRHAMFANHILIIHYMILQHYIRFVFYNSSLMTIGWKISCWTFNDYLFMHLSITTKGL